MGDHGTWIRNGTEGPLLVLAHGAGAPMDSAFMEDLSVALAGAGACVLRFEFSYMAQRRQGGPRRPPPAAATLVDEWRNTLAALIACTGPEVAGEGVFIGGKSLGGRMASQLVADRPPAGVKGCLCFGYPFHPPAKPDRWRTGHFPDLKAPMWIAQGERDPFGKRESVLEHFSLSAWTDASPDIYWVPDGDHDFIPRKRSQASREQNLAAVAGAAVGFMREIVLCPSFP